MTIPIDTQKPRGYHRLANLMGHYPEAAIFRRFGALNTIHLLSLQAELIDLQVQFRDICAEDDRMGDPDEQEFSTFFRKLRACEDSLQYDMLKDIRAKLREYNEAMIQAAAISHIPSPQAANTRFLRDWLDSPDGGANFLRDRERFTWSLREDSSASEKRFLDNDLMTLHIVPEEQDAFSKILSSSLLDLWNFLRTFGSSRGSPRGSRFRKSIDADDGIMHYSEEGLLKFNNIMISVIGAAMPIASIVALYFIETEGGRIGATAGFTILFALVLATCTNARRLEIAASTAAFAAVEVVFIGSDLGKS